MWKSALVLIWLALTVIVALVWRSMRQRELALERFSEGDIRPDPQDSARPKIGVRRLSRRWIWVPWVLGLSVAAVLGFIVGLQPAYVLAFSLMIALLTSQVEAFFAARHAAKLETQLADSIDIMIGAVGAGASVSAAIDAAITECKAPLGPYLEEVAGRIRLGDEPAEVFRSLADRVPLETFLLFTSALGVHWEVGGKLSSTLTTVGRTVRDRIEISRRIRSNSTQSQLSTVAIILLTYFIAIIIWRNSPEQMAEFVSLSIGAWFIAGTVVLQSVGVVWMNLISKPKF